jgi:hypothetical protein
MPLRNFTVEELIKAFNNPEYDDKNPDDFNASDMHKFKQKYNGHTSIINEIISPHPLTSDINKIESTITKIIRKKNELLSSITSLSDEEKDVRDMFEYSREIKIINHSNENIAIKLFVLRHLIFYQILIFVRLVVLDKNMFEKTFKHIDKFNSHYDDNDFNNLKLGIWGSVNVSSDIDIGVQYAKTNNRKKGILTYIIKIFENAFLKFTQRNTLSFDIEGYADLMYMDTNPTIFYCNSSDFTWDDLIISESSTPSLLSSIVCSMIRNYVQAKIDKDHPSYDIRRFKSNKEISEDARYAINKDINDFKITDVMKSLKKFGMDITSDKNMKKLIQTNLDVTTATNYLTNTYDDGRKTYYEKVLLAENFLADNESELLSSKSNIPNKNIRLKMMRLIACALNYRAESYVSPSTVTHIVRIIQAKYISKSPCANNFPQQDPTCVLGKMGYFMSMLEQMGYIHRFDITYCYDKTTRDDCEHKINDKYLPRFKEAFNKYRFVNGSKKTKNHHSKSLMKRKHKRSRRR